MVDRIALISDLHGNLHATEAVLADISARGISRIFNLGDLIGKGPDGAVIDRLRSLCEVTVRGNWDASIANAEADEIVTWHRNQLGHERCAWLRNLPNSFDFLLSGQRVRLFHASNVSEYHRVRIASGREAHLAMFENTTFTGNGTPPDIVGYGDIHVAFAMSFEGKTLFNPGSVGNPLDVPIASYAIVEGDYGSDNPAPWSINVLRIHYDVEAAIRAGSASGMPDADHYANELRTARYRGLTTRK